MNSHLAGLLAALKLMKTKNKLKLTVLFMNFLKYDSAEGESGEMKLTSNFSSHRSRTALVKKKKKGERVLVINLSFHKCFNHTSVS